jgi:cation diffusion facilitator CzcD-associated flavoprotein CzcO
VIGAGASAMDNAGCALEAGAGNLDMFIRRRDMPMINKGKGGNSHGSFIGYADLPDAWKWRLQHYLNRQQIPPPRDSTRRVSQHPNARFHFGSGVEAIQDDGAVITLTTPKGVYELDFLIVGTGFRTEIGKRPELANLTPHARLWADRFQPEPGLEDADLAQSPDLAPDFAFQERTPGAQPWITRVHAFNYAATLSLGKVSGDIPGVSNGAWKLADALISRLYGQDPQRHLDTLEAYDEPELLGDEWVDADA